MATVAAAAIPAVVGLASSLIGSSTASKAARESLQATRETNQTNIMLQREQRDWDAQQTNTEVQRRVTDLKAAGLNPMLAYQGSASSAAPAAPTVENPAPIYTAKAQAQNQSRQSAVDGIYTAFQVRQMQAQLENINADTQVKAAQAALTNETTRKAAYETAISGNTAGRLGVANEQQNATLAETRERILNIVKDTEYKDLSSAQLAQVGPLLVEYQRTQNTGAVLGNRSKEQEIEGQKISNILKGLDINEAQAGSTFYQQTGPSSKWLEAIKGVLSILKGHK